MSDSPLLCNTDRARFNFGFHDGAAAAEAGREPEWKRGAHFDSVYEAGYWLGAAEYRASGKRPESSDLAWLAWSEED